MILNVFSSIFMNAYKFIKLMLSGVTTIFVMIVFGGSSLSKPEETNTSDKESLFLNIESDKFKKNLVKNINILKDMDRKSS